MSSRGNLHPWFVVGIGLLLFVLLPLVRKVEGVKAPVDSFEGVWGGQIRFFLPNDSAVWEQAAGPHKEGLLFFSLKEYDHTLGRYSGKGQMYIVGEKAPRDIDASKFYQEPEGAIRMSFYGSQNFAASLTGSLKNNVLQLSAGDPTSPTMTLQLRKGSESTFRDALAQAEHASGVPLSNP